MNLVCKPCEICGVDCIVEAGSTGFVECDDCWGDDDDDVCGGGPMTVNGCE